LALLVKFPIDVNVPKDPVASDNWAVYILPDANIPELVNGTDTFAPIDADTQNGDPVMVPVVTDAVGMFAITKTATGSFCKAGYCISRNIST
jgi:hypothetical protein